LITNLLKNIFILIDLTRIFIMHFFLFLTSQSEIVMVSARNLKTTFSYIRFNSLKHKETNLKN